MTTLNYSKNDSDSTLHNLKWQHFKWLYWELIDYLYLIWPMVIYLDTNNQVPLSRYFLLPCRLDNFHDQFPLRTGNQSLQWQSLLALPGKELGWVLVTHLKQNVSFLLRSVPFSQTTVKELIKCLHYWVGQSIHSGFFWKMLWKNMNECFGQPSIIILTLLQKSEQLWTDYTKEMLVPTCPAVPFI